MLFKSPYDGSNSSLIVDILKLYQYKVKNSETKPYPLCLEKIFKSFAANNMKKKKKTGLNGYVYYWY